MRVEFLKEAQVNKITYKKGDTMSVSSSIAKSLLDVGDAKEYKPTEDKNLRKNRK